MESSASERAFEKNFMDFELYSVPIHKSKGIFLAKEGSYWSNFKASSAFPISIALCAISVNETPF